MSSLATRSAAETAASPAGDIWKALANPRRRQLLDRLRRQPQTTGELSAALPELSRFAVMQHLEVLTHAGLVVARRRGRHRVNHLNPVPLREWYERWVQPLADSTAAELLSLQRLVETQGGTDMTDMTTAIAGDDVTGDGHETPPDAPIRTIRLAAELRFRTSAERLFRAFTDESLAWFPHTYGGDRVRAVVVEPFVGGRHYEDWGDGRGHLYGHTTEYDPPFHWATRGRLMPGTIHDSSYVIEPDGDQHVTLSVNKVVTGPMNDEEAASVRMYGDVSLMADAIRAHVED